MKIKKEWGIKAPFLWVIWSKASEYNTFSPLLAIQKVEINQV